MAEFEDGAFRSYHAPLCIINFQFARSARGLLRSVMCHSLAMTPAVVRA
ncbi:MAG: hypothetical protein LBT00_16300 [Spirochaetaceae bacterium]|nr:hypothetical protein [Spirochaetaceae bacterium]